MWKDILSAYFFFCIETRFCLQLITIKNMNLFVICIPAMFSGLLLVPENHNEYIKKNYFFIIHKLFYLYLFLITTIGKYVVCKFRLIYCYYE